jgi:hypothetical protein
MGAFHAGLIWMRVPDHPLADVLTLTDRAILSVLFSFAYSDDEPRALRIRREDRSACRLRPTHCAACVGSTGRIRADPR